MSLFNFFQTPSQIQPASGASSIRGATGLSRAALARYFADNGLFGRESDLAPVEQAVVQSRLGPIPGLRGRPLLAPTDARLLTLAAFTSAAVDAEGRVSQVEVRSLEQAGFDSRAAWEVIRVVRAVRDVFGRRAVPAAADVRLDTFATPALARAA